MTTLECEQCGVERKVRSRHAGTTVRCKNCLSEIQVPVQDTGRVEVPIEGTPDEGGMRAKNKYSCQEHLLDGITNPTVRRLFPVFLAVGFIFIVVVTSYFYSSHEGELDRSRFSSSVITGVTINAVFLVIMYLACRQFGRCPECKTYWSTIETDREVEKRRTGRFSSEEHVTVKRQCRECGVTFEGTFKSDDI